MVDFTRDIEDMLRREYDGDFPDFAEERRVYEELRNRVQGVRRGVDSVDRDDVGYLSEVENDFENHEAGLEAEQED